MRSGDEDAGSHTARKTAAEDVAARHPRVG